jgi:hypothetical protein
MPMFLQLTADAWTAVFTGGLLVVAILGSYFGIRQLRAVSEQALVANELYKLEVAPIIAVSDDRLVDDPSDASHMRFVVVYEGGSVLLRPYEFVKDTVRGQGRVAHYGGTPNFRALLLEIRNAGRTPAVRLRINFLVTATDRTQADVAWWREKPISHDGPWEEGRDYPFILKDGGVGHGFLTFPVLGVERSISMRIENRLGTPVTLAPTTGSISPIAGDGKSARIEIDLVKPADGIFRIAASERTTPAK